MKKNRLLLTSLFSLIGLFLINSFSFAQESNQEQLPDISISASKNIVVLDDSEINRNIVKLNSKFNLFGQKRKEISIFEKLSKCLASFSDALKISLSSIKCFSKPA